MMQANYETRFIRVNGVSLHVVLAGPEDGEPVMLLHGFPEFWYGWRHQIDALVEQGYRVIAPDQRGYNLSDKPDDIKHYRLNLLAADVAELASTLGYESFYLVGHDWGAAVAWTTAIIYPQMLRKLVIMNVPHPAVMRQKLTLNNPMQLLRSWYIGFFQVPLLPETVVSFDNYNAFAHFLTRTSNPGSFTPEDLEAYKQAWRQPGAFKAMLNWYRALVQHPGLDGKYDMRIKVPTLMLWGENDVALGSDMAQPSIEMCEQGRLVFFPNATHWVQHDEPAAVNRMMLEFLGQPQAEVV